MCICGRLCESFGASHICIGPTKGPSRAQYHEENLDRIHAFTFHLSAAEEYSTGQTCGALSDAWRHVVCT